jgi:hypothetical protein
VIDLLQLKRVTFEELPLKVPAPILRRLPVQPALHRDLRQKLENKIYKDVHEKEQPGLAF